MTSPTTPKCAEPGCVEGKYLDTSLIVHAWRTCQACNGTGCAESKPAALFLCVAARCPGHEAVNQVCAESKPACPRCANGRLLGKCPDCGAEHRHDWDAAAPVEASAGVANERLRQMILDFEQMQLVGPAYSSDIDSCLAELLAARAEIARLTASERSAWNAAAIRDETIAARDAECRVKAVALEALTARIAALEPNARRYQHVRSAALGLTLTNEVLYEGELDAALDAEIAALSSATAATDEVKL